MKKILIISLFMALFTFIFWMMNKSSVEVSVKESVKEETRSNQVVLVEENSEPTQENRVQKTEGYFDQYLNTLPTLEDFKTLTYDEVHHSPEIIKNGGEVLGSIHNDAEIDIAKRAEAMDFFKSCAEDPMVATPIRAVCLKKIYTLIPEWKLPVELSEEKISKEVSELAMKLP